MKRLLEESTDELERELLEAGAQHRPSESNQAELLVAMSMGGALGFLGSKASNWLWTTAGKLTMLSVALCTVGAIDAVTRFSGLLAPTSAYVPALRAVDTTTVALRARAYQERLAPPEPSVLLSVSQPVSRARALSGSAVAPAPVKRSHEPSTKRAVQRASELPSADVSERVGLDAEVKLVDELRVATTGQDWLAARQLIERHRVMFPEGQLGQEVAELATLEGASSLRGRLVRSRHQATPEP